MLKYQNQTRKEADPEAIANLKSKGWVELVKPTPPAFDPATQRLLYYAETNSYSVVDKSSKEIARETLDVSVAVGFLVEPEGFILGLEDSDRNTFTQMLTLVQEAKALGLIDDTTPQTITDMSGVKHTVTTLRFRQIMVGYGFYYKTLWDLIT